MKARDENSSVDILLEDLNSIKELIEKAEKDADAQYELGLIYQASIFFELKHFFLAIIRNLNSKTYRILYKVKACFGFSL